MKRLLLCTAALLLAVNSAYSYSSGTGLSTSPYRISTKTDLMQLASTPTDHGSYFVMTNNIDMQGQVFTASVIPAGSTGFTGSFDGGGFEIYNFSINSSETYYTGVFGRLNGGTITNLGVNISPSGVTGNTYTGGLVGFSSGTITDCYFTGSVSGTGYTGGLVGYNSGTITRCSYQGDVASSGYRLGGLVGYNPNGSIADSHSSGSVTQTGTGHYTGGLIGRATGPLSSITNCFSTCQVSGFVSVGGLVGELDNVGTFSRCYATGDVTATNNTVGGLLGRLRTNTIQHCYAAGQVSSDTGNVGGLIGYNTGIVEHCYSTGNTSGTSEVGGIAGDNAGTIRNCVATGDVTGDDGYIGGLVGENNYFIERSFALGSATGGYQGVGGLVGINRHTIHQCFAAGGAISDDSDPGTSYHERYVGGLVGANTWQIENCYSTGNAYGNNMVGGLIGQNESSDDVINCYSTGDPSGADHIGGSVGYWNNGDVLDCYWDTLTSGQGNAMGYINPSGSGTTTITGMTTTDMMTQANYPNWDFAGTTLDGTGDIWFMPSGDYPKLFFCYDLDGDGELTADDIFEMFAQWLSPGIADITGPAGVPDGIVNILDFAELLEQVGSW